jgi:2-aminoadipate transaminase
MQADVRHVPMDADGMRVDLLEDLLDQLAREGRPVKYVYTIPNHQNPAGVSLSLERRHRLAELAEQHDLLILEDNPYGLLDFAGRTWPRLRELVPDRVIYVGTVSRRSPRARTGWIAAPRPVRDKLILLREAADLCPSNLPDDRRVLVRDPALAGPGQAVPRGLPRARRDDARGARHAEMPDG